MGAGNTDERHALAGVGLIGVVMRVDLGGGVALCHAGEQGAVAGRGLAVDDNRQTLACILVANKRCVDRRESLLEGRLRTSLEGMTAAVGIVEVEYRRLGVDIGAAAAGGVLLVPLYLGGATVLALDEQAERNTANMEVGCEVAGLAVCLVLGAVRVGENVLHLLANTACETAGKGGRGTHDGQELTTGDAIEFEVLSALGELPHRALVGVGAAGKATPLGLTVFDASLGHR